jgi:hypothetical protein
MKVRMHTTMAGPHGVAEAGSTVDVPVALARELVKGGHATALGEFPPESAVRKGGNEKAVKPTAEVKG